MPGPSYASSSWDDELDERDDGRRERPRKNNVVTSASPYPNFSVTMNLQINGAMAADLNELFTHIREKRMELSPTLMAFFYQIENFGCPDAFPER